MLERGDAWRGIRAYAADFGCGEHGLRGVVNRNPKLRYWQQESDLLRRRKINYAKRAAVRAQLQKMRHDNMPCPGFPRLAKLCHCGEGMVAVVIEDDLELKAWRAENPFGARPHPKRDDLRRRMREMCDAGDIYPGLAALAEKFNSTKRQILEAMSEDPLLLIWSGKMPRPAAQDRQDQTKGLICPNCLASEMKIASHFKLKGGRGRRYVCIDCNSVWTTIETWASPLHLGRASPSQRSTAQIVFPKPPDKPHGENPNELLETPDVLKEYYTSPRGLYRLLKAGELRDYRAANAPRNAPRLFKRCELDKCLRRKPRAARGGSS